MLLGVIFATKPAPLKPAEIRHSLFQSVSACSKFVTRRDVKKHFAVGAKFFQVCMPFETSEQSLCKRAGLLKHPRKVPAGRNLFCAAGKFFVQASPEV